MSDKKKSSQELDEINKKNQLKYRQQAKFLREQCGVDTVEEAVNYIRTWVKTQVFESGPMTGECVSVMLTCAIMGEAIEPNPNREISMLSATIGWDVYESLKSQGIW